MYLALALVGSGVGGHEADFIVGLDLALLHTAGKHITHTLNLVDSGDGHAQRLCGVTLGQLNHLSTSCTGQILALRRTRNRSQAF